MIFEITAKGFDGATDATDGLVLWVRADSEHAVLESIEGTGARYWGSIPGEAFEARLDFTLPQDSAALRAALTS
jgi:hypothetical protein